MLKISAAIITYNEEKNIARCIASLQGVADDIVVVDSFSTDATKDICINLGVRFVEHTFEGHIEQKNFAITQAQYPFVLSLDADEALSPELHASILQVKQNPQYDGYTMNRLTNYCGQWIRHGGWYPDTKLRLWDTRKGRWGGINPHDKVLMDTNARIAHLKGDLWHYSFYTREQHLAQIVKFAHIGAKALKEKGVRPTYFRMYLHPVARFLKMYILKAGFLDGANGFFISRKSAWGNFVKYRALRGLYKKNK